ncbi:MAG: aryl-sulfate sulfotransferase, partial [Proteobacteria bacterium]|nr:aryl-sulfate sulfotransferase [Pseudomonadota bacterium]
DQPASRAVEYKLDPVGMLVEQSWESTGFRGYSPFMGDANELQNGNILIAFGGLTDPPTNDLYSPRVKKWARVLEMDRTGKVAFEFTVRDQLSTDFHGYHVSRVERVQGFPR